MSFRRRLAHVHTVRRPSRLPAVAAAALLLAGCAAEGSVRSTHRSALPTSFDRDETLSEVIDLPAIDPIVWVECDGQPAPWECATIEVPLDYRRP